jgi:hypothetical protein
MEREEEVEERPSLRRRQRPAGQDPLPQYVAKLTGLLLALGVLAYLLLQLGQLGQPYSPPSASPTAAPLAQPPAPTAQPAPQPSLPSGQGSLRSTSSVVEPSYTVAAGDTLGSIAARFGTTVEALRSINNLPDRNVLSVGQKLVIPNQQ